VTTLIKAGHAQELSSRLAPMDLADHLLEARNIVENARRQAALILEDATRRAANEREQAIQEGHAAGYQEGQQVGREAGRDEAFREAMERFDREQGQLVSAMTEAVSRMQSLRDDLMLAGRRDVLDLALRIAERVTFTLGADHRESAQENLRRALELVGKRTDLKILVHAKDMESIQTFAPLLMERMGMVTAVKVEADGEMAPGGCRVLVGGDEVDATLETQLAAVVALLTGRSIDRDQSAES